MGLFRLIIDTPVKLAEGFSYETGSFFWIVNNIFFQYYSLIIFIVCIIVMIAVSYLTEKPAYDKISGLTFSTMTDKDRQESRASWDARDVITSVLVLVLILVAYLYFRG
jgi:SSS family solute:Na+ symporter